MCQFIFYGFHKLVLNLGNGFYNYLSESYPNNSTFFNSYIYGDQIDFLEDMRHRNRSDFVENKMRLSNLNIENSPLFSPNNKKAFIDEFISMIKKIDGI